MDVVPEGALRAWVDYLRDMGVYDLYRSAEPRRRLPEATLAKLRSRSPAGGETPIGEGRGPVPAASRPTAGPGPGKPGPRALTAHPGTPVRKAESSPFSASSPTPAPAFFTPSSQPGSPLAAPEERAYFSVESEGMQTLPSELAAPMPKPQPLESLFVSIAPIDAADRPAALSRLRAEIGDCTRCPLAYAGRHNIVFGEGDPGAELMFVGEGPGADEDASGLPFVGKAGQLLNNMIAAMGLTREKVFISNIVKCRPPANRAPEFIEATTCSQFLLRQIDIVRPKVIVALGATAATYVLGVRQPLASLRGQWFGAREAKVAVTYHPAFLLRDPRQKAEAWKDLQRVMAELGLTPPSPRKG